MPSPTILSSDTDAHRGLRRLRRMAWLCAAMVLTITSLSAFLRLVNTGVGCTPWPTCYGQLGAAATDSVQAGASTVAVATARAAHRVLASASLLIILALLGLALKRRWWRHARLAAGLLALALFLAALGAAARSSLLPAVTLGNLLAGMGMLALSVRLARLAGTPGRPAALARWAWAALALTLLQVALGALVSSGHAGLSCPALGACDVSVASWRSLNPWLAPAIGTSPDHPGGALLHLLHRAGGLAFMGFMLVMGWRLARLRHPWTGAMLLALSTLQMLLGLGLVAWQLPLVGAWAHNLLAALLMALLASLTTLQDTASTPP